MRKAWKYLAIVLVSGAVLALPAQAATPKLGQWGGSTGQGARVHFAVKKKPGGTLLVKRIVASRIDTACVGLEYPPGTEKTFRNVDFFSPYETKVRRDGTFSLPDYAGPDTYRFKGRFTSKKRASGTLVADVAGVSGGVCKSGKVSWAARLS